MIERGLVAGIRVMAVAMLAMLAACGTPSRPITLEDRDDALEFQQMLRDSSNSATELLRDSQRGKSISEFSAGMLAFDILTTTSSVDPGLHDYFTADGKDIEGYLKTRFQDHPEDEIATLAKMSGEGHPTLRVAARYTLEMLAHIPDSHDSPAVQRANRQVLENALQQVKSSLDKAADDIVIP